MKIRKGVVADAKAIANVQVDTWKTSFRNIVPEAYLKEMSYDEREKMWRMILSRQTVYVAENEQGQIVGFANGRRERGGDYKNYEGEIYAIYILEAYQRKGLVSN